MVQDITIWEQFLNLLSYIILSLIVAIIVAFLIWFIKLLIQRRKVKIISLYPNKIYPGMALGVRGIGFSPKIENNKAFFYQNEEILSVDGDKITGGSSAPLEGILTIELPKKLEYGKGKIAISNEISISNISNKLDFELLNTLPAPKLTQLQTDFASQRDTGIISGKLIVIGGEGFALNEKNNEVIFEWYEDSTKKTKATYPSEVRGDALLGVKIPPNIPTGNIEIKVRTIINGIKSESSNAIKHHISPPPKLKGLNKPYIQPKEKIKIYGEDFDPNNRENNIVIIRPYQTRMPISCIPDIVTQNEITVKIPKNKNVVSGPSDLTVEVHGVPSSNSLLLDVQHKMSFLKKYFWRRT